MNDICTELLEGVLLVDKPEGKTSFSLITALRKLTGIKKIGHAGTLDPFATGVMVLLMGKRYTLLSDKLLLADKAYHALINLGITTDTYDCDGKIVARSKRKCSYEEVEEVCAQFQGEIAQTPPMFSAKKVEGKKLYELAREGITIERKPTLVKLETKILHYEYPYLELSIDCSKGTYIRSLAHEIGEKLGVGAHLAKLRRTRSGHFHLNQCIDGQHLFDAHFDITPYLLSHEHLSLSRSS